MSVFKINTSSIQSMDSPPSDTAQSIAKKLALSVLCGHSTTIQKSGLTIEFIKRSFTEENRTLAATRTLRLRLFFTLIHELGHAFVAKLNNNKPIEIRIITDDESGNTHETCHGQKSPLVESAFLAAGPLASTTTGLALLGLTVILAKYCPDLGPLLIIAAGWGYTGGLLPELFYLFSGIYEYCKKNSEGMSDWSKLFTTNKAAFSVASALVVCQTLLGTAAYYMIFTALFCNDQAQARLADRINLVKSLFA